MLAENVKRFSGEALESKAQDDESNIAVFGAGGGICGERSGEGGLQDFIA